MSRRKQTIPKPLREEVWRKDNPTKLDSMCPICCRNKISALNFECGHIQSEHHGGATTLNNLMAICGSCNKSMGTKNLNHFRVNLWRGRKYPGNDKRFEISNTLNHNEPIPTNKLVTSLINFDDLENIIEIYLKFDTFMRPRAHMSDVADWHNTYLCICDSLKANPHLIKTMDTFQCINIFSQTKTWYATAGCYERNKLDELKNTYRTKLIKIKNS